MNLKQAFETFKDVIYTRYKGDPAKIMVHTGTVGWILSSAAQLWNIQASKDFTPEQKKFLFPQEALDAAINITLFYTLTNSCKNLTAKLVSSGKLLSQPLRKFIETPEAKLKIEEAKKGDFGPDLGEIFKDDKEFFTKYHPFKNGVNMAVNTVACIIASNLLTPLVRNKFASIEQKHLINNVKKPIAQLPAEKPTNMDDFNKLIALNSSKETNAQVHFLAKMPLSKVSSRPVSNDKTALLVPILPFSHW